MNQPEETLGIVVQTVSNFLKNVSGSSGGEP